MNIRPKTFYAARAFTHAGVRYEIGDVVPSGRTLADTLAFDQGFVTTTRPAKSPADEAPTNPADTATATEE